MASEQLRVLITNDDGYQARGIRALAHAVASAGHEVLVVAPLTDQSGVGTARAGWVNRPIKTASEDADGITYIGVDGTPALAVTMARLGAFGKSPELVVSGINHGYNFGAILHSGTVGAALTGATQGLSGLAISIGSEHPQHLEVAADIAAELIGWVRDEPVGTVLNINVPDVPKADLRGVRTATLAPVNPTRLKASVAPTGEPIMILRDPDPSQYPDSDESLLAEGYVTLTSITGVTARDDETPARYLTNRLT
ncbi:5'/3'-nucleotidase SurE [Kribbella monticola]|uniref:5'/3'-nucleotidase SurE n=1 Tax=Kribbella monticola TaxID=2185285 RepID=UPI000DD411A1|nr:5'/3'-nucleotidase SurE [Kribbella monticola]